MPIIRDLLKDPADLVMQGEQLRTASFLTFVDSWGANTRVSDAANTLPFLLVELEDEEATGMIANGTVPYARLRSIENGALMSANCGIATPCGAMVYMSYNPINTFVEASVLWALTGVTRDYTTQTAIAGCAVDAHEFGRLAVAAGSSRTFYSVGNPNPGQFEGNQSLVGRAISDGSGNYTIPVGTNTAYQLVAYKVGSPYIAGITRQDVTPTAVG
jgi:hypothetical protein